MNVAPSSTFEATASGFATGLTGTIGVRILDNAGATTTARVTAGIAEYPASSGVYYVSLTAPSTAGQYTLLWDNGSTTPGNIATEDLVVTYTITSATAAANEYVTVSELKNTLAITSSTYDADLAIVVNTASRTLDAITGRRFWSDTGTANVRTYTPDSYRRLMIDDLQTLTTLKVDQNGDGTFEETWTVGTDFVLEPQNADSDIPIRPYESVLIRKQSRYYFPVDLEQSVQITGKFGWAAVPDEIQSAASILAGKLFKRMREAPFGIVSFGGGESPAMRLARTDPDIGNLIQGYIRHTPFL